MTDLRALGSHHAVIDTSDEEAVATVARSSPEESQRPSARRVLCASLALGCCVALATLRQGLAVPEQQDPQKRGPPATPRSMLDCSWIAADDCKFTDIWACTCREQNQWGPCSPCDPATKRSTRKSSRRGGNQSGGARTGEAERGEDMQTTATTASLKNLFCYALILPGSSEPGLIAAQKRARVGIYDSGCDTQRVYSSEAVAIEGEHAEVVTDREGTPLDMHCGFATEWHLAMNGRIFAELWQFMLRRKEHAGHKWTVKADADSVFLPRILLMRLSNLDPNEPIFVQNCPEEGQYIHGPLEVVSQAGFEKLHIEKCQDLLYVDPTNREDWFLGKCLERNGAWAKPLPEVMLEQACPPFPPANFYCAPGHAVYHPFKTPEAWSTCHSQATRFRQ